MSNKIWLGCSAIACVLGIALAVYAATSGECGGCLELASGGCAPMKCHWTFLAVAALGGVQAVIAAVGIAQKEASGRRVAAIGIIVSAAAALLLLYVVMGVCANAEMICNNGRTIAAVLLAVSIVVAVVGLAKANPRKDEMPKAKL